MERRISSPKYRLLHYVLDTEVYTADLLRTKHGKEAERTARKIVENSIESWAKHILGWEQRGLDLEVEYESDELENVGLSYEMYQSVTNALLKMKVMRDAKAAQLFPEIVAIIPPEKEERDAEFLLLSEVVINNSYDHGLNSSP